MFGISLDQWMIAVTGGLSIWMITDDKRSYRLMACVFALLGQPFWFWAAYKAQQWGIFAIDVVYTAGWIKGLLKNWKE